MDHPVAVEWYGRTLQFATHEHLFAPRAADRGSLAMLRTVDWRKGEKVLDLGCGYGLVGICAAVTPGVAEVVMVDNDPLAVEFARRNALQLEQEAGDSKNADGKGASGTDLRILLGDGPGAVLAGADGGDSGDSGDIGGFTLILSNPPYHTDFAVAKRFIEQGFACLELGGRMMMVVKRLAWYQNKMSAVFGGTKVTELDGYFILTSEKRTAQSQHATKSMPPKTTKKHRKKMMAQRGKH
ncbi:MAG TPA: methyltransferase [Firmicutes bacterium]|nr:methyltransferase [Bacillota bacterium]